MIIGTAGFTAMESLLALEDRGLAKRFRGPRHWRHRRCRFPGRRVPRRTRLRRRRLDWLARRVAVADRARRRARYRSRRHRGQSRSRSGERDLGRRHRLRRRRHARADTSVPALRRVPSRRAVSWRVPTWRRRSIPSSLDRWRSSASTRSKPRRQTRTRVWSAIGDSAPRVDFDALVDREVQLEELAAALEVVRNGKTRGRILVNPTPG